MQQEWFPNANFAGAAYARHEFAKANHINLDILPGSDHIDAITQVVSGKADFGDASGDRVLLANLKGADLVVVGTVSQYSPTCFLVHRNSGISMPRDFQGKTIGVLTGTNTEKIYRMLLRKFDLPSPQPKEVEAPFELTSFIARAYDVRPAFIYDEPITLKEKGVDFTVINPIDYGVKFVGTVYFCKRDLIRKKPAAVQGFVDSVCDGWKAAIRHPEQAIAIVKQQFPDIDEKRELASLREGMPYFKRDDERLLVSVPEDWKQMIADLVQLGGEHATLGTLDLSTIIDNTFVDKYYAKVENK